MSRSPMMNWGASPIARWSGSNNSTTTAYDAMSRVNGITNPLGTFGYNYVDQSSGSDKGTTRLASMTYPNGQVTNYS